MVAETKTVVSTEQAPGPFQGAPYSQAIRVGGFVFVSGQLGLKLGDGEISGFCAHLVKSDALNCETVPKYEFTLTYSGRGSPVNMRWRSYL